MYTGGDTTRFLGMWLVDSSHRNTVARVLEGVVKLPSIDLSVVTKGLGTNVLVYTFKTFIVDIKDCMRHP